MEWIDSLIDAMYWIHNSLVSTNRRSRHLNIIIARLRVMWGIWNTYIYPRNSCNINLRQEECCLATFLKFMFHRVTYYFTEGGTALTTAIKVTNLSLFTAPATLNYLNNPHFLSLRGF